jgi:hypothetical protein
MIKLTKKAHMHNGVMRHHGDVFRVPDDVAVCMRRRGECEFVGGKPLVKEREAKKARAKDKPKK